MRTKSFSILFKLNFGERVNDKPSFNKLIQPSVKFIFVSSCCIASCCTDHISVVDDSNTCSLILFFRLFILSGFSLTTIYESEDCREKGRAFL